MVYSYLLDLRRKLRRLLIKCTRPQGQRIAIPSRAHWREPVERMKALILSSLHKAVAVAAVTVASGGLSFGGHLGWPHRYPQRIGSQQDAEQLPANSSLAFACAKCKTVSGLGSRETRTFVAWFSNGNS
jgi:hypothetical protein